MRLYTTNHSIRTAFDRLLNKYSRISLVSAWAGIDFDISEQLIKKLNKAEHVVIGTHFYQTHPEFIRRTREARPVKFVLKTDGVFHPKMYAFYNSPADWTLLVGSANFTKGAFNKNSEVLLEVTSHDKDQNDGDVFRNAMQFIKQCWAEASKVSKDEYLDYLKNWRSNQWHRNKLAGDKAETSEIDSELTSFQKLNWNSYIRELLTHEDEVKSRLRLLEYAAEKFAEEPIFGNWDLEDKLLIAGVSSSGRDDVFKLWAHLGTASRQTNFRQYLDNPNSWVCHAIEAIPLEGEVTQEHYDEFKRRFTRVYKRTSITSASRLLAMKRPDTFYCYTSENRDEFAERFDISPTTVNLDNYWERVVMKIRESNWSNVGKPRTLLEGRIEFAKAAILDAICYNF